MASSHEVLTHTNDNIRSKEMQAEPLNLGNNGSRKSWQEIKQAVRSSRKLHSQFTNKIPHAFNFVKSTKLTGSNFSDNDTASFDRLFFLGVFPEQRENTLIYVDIPDEQKSGSIDKPIQWNQVLGMFQPSSQSEKYSKEEELLRERKRLGMHGITSYEISHDKRKLLFPAASSLFCIDLQDVGPSGSLIPKEIILQQKGPKLDPKMCPENPDVIAYVCSNDLWVVDVKTGSEKRLTYTHKGSANSLENTLSAGVASYIMQEEFDRYTGYWWQPNNTSGVYRILYEEVDESDVEVCNIANFSGKVGVDSYRYPRTGTSNPKVTLKLVEFTINDNQISDPITKTLSQHLEDCFPWCEYVARINWLNDGKGIWAQLLDRMQQRTSIVYFPLELFTATECPTTTDIEMADDSTDSSQNAESCFKVIYEETSEVWITVHDTFYFCKTSTEESLEFIWASEKTGHRHLYHVTCNIKEQNGTKRQRHNSGEAYNCVTSITALTSGDWEVLETLDSLWVDEDRKLIYFMGLRDTVLESHLYVTSYAENSVPVRLTQLGFSHTVAIDQNCEFFASVYSSTKQLYAASVHSLINSTPLPRPVLHVSLLEPMLLPSNYSPPEIFSFTNSSGVQLNGMFHKPLNLQPGKKYPTVLYVYGGPHVQLVTNSFKGLRYQRLYTLASLGYVVVAIDGRGSSHRGLEFESIFKNKMGQVELQDQVEGLQHLSEKLGYIDLSRVAIHGWSYGGYLTLMGLVQRPDVFKIGIAGAPVTCWKLYDTGYTERYMGLPDANTNGYHYGSVLKSAAKFPDEPNRLFLVHGVIDENVHFVHTAQLISSLVKHCKPYQLQIYPNERHGIRSSECNEHYEVIVISYLQQYL